MRIRIIMSDLNHIIEPFILCGQTCSSVLKEEMKADYWLQILTVILSQKQNFATINIYDEKYMIRIQFVKSYQPRAVTSTKEVYVLTSVYLHVFAFRIEV